MHKSCKRFACQISCPGLQQQRITHVVLHIYQKFENFIPTYFDAEANYKKLLVLAAKKSDNWLHFKKKKTGNEKKRTVRYKANTKNCSSSKMAEFKIFELIRQLRRENCTVKLTHVSTMSSSSDIKNVETSATTACFVCIVTDLSSYHDKTL